MTAGGRPWCVLSQPLRGVVGRRRPFRGELSSGLESAQVPCSLIPEWGRLRGRYSCGAQQSEACRGRW